MFDYAPLLLPLIGAALVVSCVLAAARPIPKK